MRRRMLSMLLCLSLFGTTFASSANAVGNVNQRLVPLHVDKSSKPLSITEVYSDDKANPKIEGAGDQDLFEYVEIYNNTNEKADFNKLYGISYSYDSKRKDLSVASADKNDGNVIIPANSPAVFWVERTNESISGAARNLTEADFRNYHNIPDNVPVFKVRGQDGIADSDGDFIISKKDNKEDVLSEVSYTKQDVADGKSLHLRVPASGTKSQSYKQKGEPTAGTIENEQFVPQKNSEPIIKHKPADSVEQGSELKVSAEASDADGDPLTVKLFYKSKESNDYKEYQMKKESGTKYTYSIPAKELSGNKASYYIIASDGKASVQSDEFATAFAEKKASLKKAGSQDKKPAMPVLLTEVYPNDKAHSDISGAGSNDLYEYVEIYNNTSSDINFNELYKVRYNYVSNLKDLSVTSVTDAQDKNVIIPAKKPAVLWVERTSGNITGDAKNVTEADFRAYHNIPESVPVFKLRGQDGLANADRGFQITNKENNNEIISEVFYTNDDVADGKSQHLRVPKSGSLLVNYLQKGNTSAGDVAPDQLIPSENKEPLIQHQPLESVKADSDFKVTAEATDADSDPLTLKLYYKTSESAEYTKKEMTKESGSNFSYTIPKDELSGSKVSYYLEASDGETVSRSTDYVVPVHGANPKTPPVLITEIAPHPAGDFRLGTGNQYEFIEFYNNSDKPLNLKGYSLFYLYPGNTEPKKWTIPVDTNIEPYSTGVIWFAKEAISAGFTNVADFNTHYNSTLKDNDVIFYDNSKPADFNLPNATNRGYAISSSDSVNDIIVEAWYDSTNASSPDRLVNDVRNGVIRYSYPDSGKKMERLDTRNYANPGNLDKGQVPLIDGNDMIAPSIKHDQLIYNVEKNKATKITIESDEELSKSELKYGLTTDKGTDFTGSTDLILKEKSDGRYVYEGSLTISEPGTYRYMIVAEDKSGNVTKFPYNSLGNVLTVNEKGRAVDLPEKGLSLKEGAMLKENVGFYAYGEKANDEITVTLNGDPLDLRPALPGPVQFGFQSRSIDQIYQASASAKNPSGESKFIERLLPKYLQEAWYLYDVSPDYFVSNQSVSIHTGNENMPYSLDTHDQYFGKTNYDDFDVKNVHIILPDGTLIKPETVRNYLGSKSETEVSYSENVYFPLGDGGGGSGSNLNKPLISEFKFPIPSDKYTARYSEIDTSKLADGTYSLEMKIGNDSIQKVETKIDNTKPVIKGIKYGTEDYLEDSKSPKGPITFSVEADDNLTGISKVEAKLDDKKISLPYETSSAILSPGEHVISVTAYDGAGNQATKSVTFNIDEEKPLEPGQVSPEDFADSVSRNATLRAKVTDPSGDRMDVGFYKGSKYDFARKGHIKGFTNIADREPPLTVAPSGETAIEKNDQAKIAFEDGKYLVNDSPSGFPYHRFEISVDEQLNNGSTVELYWKGKTLPNRKVTLYAWDYQEEKWQALKAETGSAEEKDIVLSSEVEIGKYVKNGKIQAMVQDEIKNPNDPFTMLWFTDTQFYAESYPHIFDTLGDWIVDEYKKGSFEYAINTGDLVNIANDDAQWKVADRNLKKLDDAGVPYGVLGGNHDVIIDGVDYSYYKKYVGADRYKNKPWFGGDMDNNRNHYDLVSFGGHDFIILYIGFGTEDTPETIAWANEVLKKHSDRNAILAMHAYLEGNATLSKMAQNVFDQVVKQNDNVLMTVSGHYHGANRRVSTVTNSDGSKRQVLEMLSDYQGGPEGGQGYVRFLTFDPEAGKLDVVTYSPYKNDYNFFDDGDVDTFTEDIQLKDYNKRVATDYFAANVYSNEKIGEHKNVESGGIASAEWRNLKANETYYWYMNITDRYGASRRSDIYRFSTGPAKSPNPNPPGDDDGDDKDPIDNDPNDKDPIDKDPVDKDPNEKDPVEKDPSEKDPIDNNPNDKDPINTDPVDYNPVDQDPQNNGNGQDESFDPSDENLPNTATNVYNWLAAGGILLTAGTLLLVIRRRKIFN
ncbi:lamin tail domain-containing protein [Bacillus gobiensis]|uniref:lamin tail domain-containing protein n=1 Tax=Bacillus gobiensis TaxID=1441095 RepID=UPI003D1CF6FE